MDSKSYSLLLAAYNYYNEKTIGTSWYIRKIANIIFKFCVPFQNSKTTATSLIFLILVAPVLLLALFHLSICHLISLSMEFVMWHKLSGSDKIILYSRCIKSYVQERCGAISTPFSFANSVNSNSANSSRSLTVQVSLSLNFLLLLSCTSYDNWIRSFIFPHLPYIIFSLSYSIRISCLNSCIAFPCSFPYTVLTGCATSQIQKKGDYYNVQYYHLWQVKEDF